MKTWLGLMRKSKMKKTSEQLQEILDQFFKKQDLFEQLRRLFYHGFDSLEDYEKLEYEVKSKL